MAATDLPLGLDLMRQAWLGLPVALGASALFYAALMAGGLVDDLRGARETSAMPVFAGATTPLGTLLGLLVAILFLQSGGAARLVGELAATPTGGSALANAAASVSAAIGVAYLLMTKEGRDRAADRATVAEMPLTFYVAAAMLAAFAVISLMGGLVFNIITVAIPKIVDEKFAQDIPLALVGSVATFVLLFGGIAQLTVGRLVSIYPPHLLFLGIGLMQVVGLGWAPGRESHVKPPSGPSSVRPKWP